MSKRKAKAVKKAKNKSANDSARRAGIKSGKAGAPSEQSVSKTAEAKSSRAGALSEIGLKVKAVCIEGKPMFFSSEYGKCVLRNHRDAKTYFSNIGWYDDAGRWHGAFPVWQRLPIRKNYKGLIFRPRPPCVADPASADSLEINLWTGWSVEPKPGGRYEKLKELMLNGLCSSDEELFKWFWGYLAHSVQKPDELVGTAIVMYGPQGVGKNTIFNAASVLCKNHSFEVSQQDQLTGRFTSHLCNLLYLLSDEATYAKSKQAQGRLKALITSGLLAVEEKNKPIFEVQNFTRLFISTNSDEAYPSEIGERRSAVFKFASDYKGDKSFFKELYRELASGGSEALLCDLLHADLSALPDPRVIPQTEGLIEQKINSLDSVNSFALDALEAGAIVRNPEYKYESAWPCWVAVSDLWENYLLFANQGKYRYTEKYSGGLLKKLTPLLGLSEQSKTVRMRKVDGPIKIPKARKVPSLEESAEAFRKATGLPVAISSGVAADGESVADNNYVVIENVVPLVPRQTIGMTGANHG